MSDDTTRRIGDYEVLGELGSGGMGRVYKVRNVISERIEAMKILLPDLAGRQELAARFLREIKVLASLNHPNIAQLRTALTVDNQLIMIMEYVEGTSLATRLERGPIVMADAINYISQVLDALSYAHQQHVIHRDIKPANFMLTPQGVVKLMDFGIARSEDSSSLTMSGTTLGSLNYMSPEQVKGQPTDARSDLYSVGISLYEMVTGQKPFNANSDYAIMSAHVKEVPRPPIELQPGLPSTLNEIILMAIAKDPAQRFQTADAFHNALSKVQPVAMPAAASTTRKATIVDSGLSSALFHEAPTVTAPPVTATSASRPSDHARTMVDTRTPSSPGIAPQISTKTPSSPRMQPPPPPQTSHKGLYMALGALAVVAALAAVGIYSRKAEAGGNVSTTKPAPAPPPQKVQPQKQEIAQPTPPPAPVTPPVTKAVAVAKIGVPKPQQTIPDTAPPPAPAASATDLDALEHEIDQLTARAGSINSSLDRLQAEQARAGYGLRGDMAQHQSSMKLNLQKAQDAIEHGDAARAKRYKEYCEADADALEKFLGR